MRTNRPKIKVIKPWRAFLLVRKVDHMRYYYIAWRQDGKLVGRPPSP